MKPADLTYTGDGPFDPYTEARFEAEDDARRAWLDAQIRKDRAAVREARRLAPKRIRAIGRTHARRPAGASPGTYCGLFIDAARLHGTQPSCHPSMISEEPTCKVCQARGDRVRRPAGTP